MIKFPKQFRLTALCSFTLVAFCLANMARPQSAEAHCEIPCGIYGDLTRVDLLYENITTIEKSMNEINRISKTKSPNWNQLVRWVNNKEEHAHKIQHIATQYFLTQRVKSSHKKYAALLKTLHGMMVQAMKAKQTTDKTHVTKLRAHVASLSKLYFAGKDIKHLKEHHPNGK